MRCWMPAPEWCAGWSSPVTSETEATSMTDVVRVRAPPGQAQGGLAAPRGHRAEEVPRAGARAVDAAVLRGHPRPRPGRRDRAHADRARPLSLQTHVAGYRPTP